MKPTIAILCCLFLFVFSSTGCAGSAARTTDPEVSSEAPATVPAAATAEAPPATISSDDDHQPEAASTPFGDVKRKKPPAAGQTNAPAPGQAAVQAPADDEIVSTPFGYVKRKKEGAGKTAAAPAPEKPASGVSPATVIAPAASPPAGSPQAAAAWVKPAAGAGEVPVIAPPEDKGERQIPEEPGQIRFDFDDAELDAVIRAMADYLKITYIIDPGVSGKVTIHTAGHIKASDVFPIFYQTLEVNGLTAVKEGNVYRIMKIKDASRMPIVSHTAENAKDVPPEERIVLQIIPLKFISAQEVSKVIAPFVSPDGAVIAEGISNTLLVVDKGINIVKVLKLVDVFDVSMFEKANYRFYTLQNASAEDVAKTLGDVAPLPSGGGKDEVKFIPIDWLNALLIVSSSPDIFNRVDPLIRQLDIPGENAQPQLYVYAVKNGMAVDLGDTLRAIFGVSGGQAKTSQREVVPTNPFARGAKSKSKEISKSSSTSSTSSMYSTSKTETAPDKPDTTAKAETAAVKSTSTKPGASATLRGDVRITEDQIRNALIIEAIPSDYKMIERVLERLDVLPRQVLIDVVIAEVTLGKGMDLGVEWTFKKGNWTENGALSASVGGTGLQYTLGMSHEWQAALHALANESKLQIISSPSVLASDNKQAKIDVTTEVPIPSTNYTYVTGGDNVLETSVEYRDTGVILDVTPHINEYGLVTMEISQEVSSVGQLMKVAGQDYYAFDNRKILTSLTVKHNQSIVIGGLISKQRKGASSGVPWLLKLPVIRWLTGTVSDDESKSELIVMITPHVITSLEDVDLLSQEFRRKVDGVMTDLK